MGYNASAIVAYGYVLGSDEGWHVPQAVDGEWRPSWMDGLTVTESAVRARLEGFLGAVGDDELELIATGYDFDGDMILGFELVRTSYQAVEWVTPRPLSRLLAMDAALSKAADRLELDDQARRQIWVTSLYG